VHRVTIALVGTIFYALAGMSNVTGRQSNKLQSFAMASDLFAAAVLVVSCTLTVARRGCTIELRMLFVC
jgi:hypothetical protein